MSFSDADFHNRTNPQLLTLPRSLFAILIPHHDTVSAIASGPTVGVALRWTFHHHFADSADEPLVAELSAPLLIREENLVATFLLLGRHVIEQRGAARAGTRRILEDEGVVEARFVHQRARLLEIGIGLPGIAYDDIGGQRELGIEVVKLLRGREILRPRVVPPHLEKHTVGSRLHRQMR